MSFTHMSRADLIGELMASGHPVSQRASDCASEIGVIANAEIQAAVTRKLRVARELLLRDLKEAMKTGPCFHAPAEMRDWLRLLFAGLDHEVFVVLYLDAQHRLIDAVHMFRGTLTQTSVYPREVVKGALLANAAAAAFAHNHPSGSAEPSRADEHLTHTLKSALALIDVRVVDHFVVANATLTSFAERGLL